MAAHAPEDVFLLIERDALLPIPVPAWAMGSAISVTQQGASGGSTATTTAIATGENLRPPAPVDLKAVLDSFGNLVLGWIRRSRTFAWIDDVDAPLGESKEIYEVNVEGTSGAAEYSTNSAGLTIASGELGALGSGPATISVRQIGDWAASRPSTTVFSLP